MKVAELRAELSKRGADTKGTKPVLLARLKDLVKQEEAAPAAAAPEAVEEAAPVMEEAPASEPEPEPSPEAEVVEAEAVEAVEMEQQVEEAAQDKEVR